MNIIHFNLGNIPAIVKNAITYHDLEDGETLFSQSESENYVFVDKFYELQCNIKPCTIGVNTESK